jgi:hypothetical protein
MNIVNMHTKSGKYRVDELKGKTPCISCFQDRGLFDVGTDKDKKHDKERKQPVRDDVTRYDSVGAFTRLAFNPLDVKQLARKPGPLKKYDVPAVGTVQGKPACCRAFWAWGGIKKFFFVYIFAICLACF